MTVSASRASSSSLARLEPLLLLAKSARGAAAAKLIVEATAAQGCYLFSELAHTEGVVALAQDSTYTSSTALLNLFLYGTLSDYLASPASYPTLTQNHISKLRQLTLVSLASSARTLDYSRLLSELKLNVYIAGGNLQFDGIGATSSSASSADDQSVLKDMDTIRALEDVIIEAIYAGLLTGRFDQRSGRFHVDSVMGRDVGGDVELKQMEDALRAWGDTTTSLLAELSQRIDRAKEESAEAAQVRNAHERDLASVLSAALKQPSSGSYHPGYGGGVGDAGGPMGWQDTGDDEMDLDGTEAKKGGSLKKNRTKRTRT